MCYLITESEIKKSEAIGPSRFTFNGNIIAELGKESISNPNIAIAELIKNSYDADAKKVVVNFHNMEKHNAYLVVADDGTGMDVTQIKDKWMDIGSPHKGAIERTPVYKRIPVGAKGVGRFASHCLANMLKLLTASKDDPFGYKLTFDWKKFTSSVKATDIDVQTERFRKKKVSGTALTLEELQHQWNDGEKLKSMLKDMYLLISPIDCLHNFRIKTNISKEITTLKKIDKDFLDMAGYHLHVQLVKQKQIHSKFYKNGVLEKEDTRELKSVLCCGDATFDLYFYYKVADKWKTWLGRDINKKDIDEIKSILDEYGGIKLYRDHFRVKPYGDKDADWIGLDKWSRDTTMVPGNTQVFGVVSIGRDTNPLIEDTTSREGVINNDQYFDLVTFVTTCIELFVERRSEIETSKAKARKPKTGTKKGHAKITPVTPKTAESRQVSPSLIDFRGSYPQSFYDGLEDEINGCHNSGYPNATFFLCRKMVENLIYNILEKKFPDKKELWWDDKYGYHLNLSPLLKNLYMNRSAFKPNVKDYIEKFYELAKTFRDETNNASHNIYDYLSSKEELEKFKIKDLIQLLINIYTNM